MTLPAMLDVSMEIVPHPLLSEHALVRQQRQRQLPIQRQQQAPSMQRQQRVQLMERRRRARQVDQQQRPPIVGPQ